ncbi:undecaprenyl-diphosphate phosphatase [Candidatus Laterigemmans baculatus]|uniref:undecaprenyl-diphosphate phosphatase n=1 Tax=Candidatus Laterigemmans baculatus TaxID=2770505 RepID=UPI001F3E0EB9|nr:undecaprenyl-diphosphate phosphatase [Candidatus Laterigemmans baculatus]
MLILAIVQGIAEFLPISSSGHLVIVGALLGGSDETATVEIILHAGTLASILVVYWQRIFALLRADRRVIPLLIVGTLPAAVLGLTIKSQAEWLLSNPLLAGCMLLVTGGLLLMLKWLPEGTGEYQQMRLWEALLVGCFQAFALLPGISRSGSTIVGARLLGMGRTDAVTFSFLLAIPAILGASVLAVRDLVQEEVASQATAVLALGAVVSFVVGIGALRWLIRWAREGRLYWFAAWCIPVGLLVIAMYFAGKLS